MPFFIQWHMNDAEMFCHEVKNSPHRSLFSWLTIKWYEEISQDKMSSPMRKLFSPAKSLLNENHGLWSELTNALWFMHANISPHKTSRFPARIAIETHNMVAWSPLKFIVILFSLNSANCVALLLSRWINKYSFNAQIYSVTIRLPIFF